MRKLQPCHSKLSLYRWRDERPVDSVATVPNTAGPHAAMDKIKRVGTADGAQRVATDGVQQGMEGDYGLRWRWRLWHWLWR